MWRTRLYFVPTSGGAPTPYRGNRTDFLWPRVQDMVNLSTPPKHIVDALQKLMRVPTVKSILCPHEPGAGGRRYHPKLAAYWALNASGDTMMILMKNKLSNM